MYHLLTQPVQRTVQKIRNFAIKDDFNNNFIDEVKLMAKIDQHFR